MKTLFLSWGMLILSVIFNAYGVFVIKLRLNELGGIGFDSVKSVVGYFLILLKSPLVLSGVILFAIAPFLFAVALSRMDVIVAYPAQIGLNFLILFLLALCFLGEQLTFYKLLGIVLIFAGVIFLK